MCSIKALKAIEDSFACARNAVLESEWQRNPALRKQTLKVAKLIRRLVPVHVREVLDAKEREIAGGMQ